MNRLRISGWIGFLLLGCTMVNGAAEELEAPKAGGQLTTGQMAAELRSDVGRALLRVRFFDHRYLFPEHRWVERVYLPFFRSYVERLAVDYREDGFDDDNYAHLFKTSIGLSNHRSGRSASGEVACGIIEVSLNGQDSDTILDTRNRVWHRIVLRTDAGWFVVDPQQVSMTPLAAFAKDHYVNEIFF